MRWFHFAGNGSTAYTHLILNTHGFILPTGSNAEIEECVRRIMVSVHQNQPNPHIISLTINKLLVLLVLVLGEKKKSDLEIAIQDSADYMTYNYADKSLSIEHLSQRAALSTCYYMRKFKEYQSATPHQFLQTVRLSAAKQQLLTTSQSIETIADNGLVPRDYPIPGAYGGFYIDATMGNGRDTLMLCTLAKETGSVLAFDIQDTALEATQRLLKEQGCLGRAKLIRDGHEHMDLYAGEGTADVICFNFGYLPGGSHHIATRAQPAWRRSKKD